MPPARCWWDWREKLFISWVGLRGAVPIVLAMFPWLAGFDNWPFFFNVAFFIVLVSLVLQGWTVAPFARRLKLDVPTTSSRVQRVELGVPGQGDYEFVGYKLAEGSPAVHKSTEQMPLPSGVRLLCALRNDQPLEIRGGVVLEPGDHVYLLASASNLAALDKLLVGVDEPDRLSAQAFFGEFVVTPRAKLEDLGMLYGFVAPEDKRNWSIARYIYSQYRHPVVGDRVRLGNIEFVVLEMKDSKLTKVSLKLHQ